MGEGRGERGGGGGEETDIDGQTETERKIFRETESQTERHKTEFTDFYLYKVTVPIP